jgi:hypothetical protein
MNKTMIRSMGAIIAGMLVIIIFSIATDGLMVKLGIFPPLDQGTYNTNMLIIALFYRSAYAVLGGYVTARISSINAMRNAIILGIIGTVLGIMGAITGWNLSAHWYPIALVITAIPCTWLGAKIYLNKH